MLQGWLNKNSWMRKHLQYKSLFEAQLIIFHGAWLSWIIKHFLPIFCAQLKIFSYCKPCLMGILWTPSKFSFILYVDNHDLQYLRQFYRLLSVYWCTLSLTWFFLSAFITAESPVWKINWIALFIYKHFLEVFTFPAIGLFFSVTTKCDQFNYYHFFN